MVWLRVMCWVFFWFVFLFFGGFKGQVRWPKGPPYLALNPPYLFCFVFGLFFWFSLLAVVSSFVFVFAFACFLLEGFKGQVRLPEGPPHLAIHPPQLFFWGVLVCFGFVFVCFRLNPLKTLFFVPLKKNYFCFSFACCLKCLFFSFFLFLSFFLSSFLIFLLCSVYFLLACFISFLLSFSLSLSCFLSCFLFFLVLLPCFFLCLSFFSLFPCCCPVFVFLALLFVSFCFPCLLEQC